ncbi:MAG: integral rane sensor signal transduction histidine kinase [Pseudonocardia sp.]|nr:integral rane sensor signal transduction histidine kinase [Pseudonocardia sp.]
MSSSPPPTEGAQASGAAAKSGSAPPASSGLRGRLAGIPLRTRLVAALLTLLTLVCIVVGVVTAVALRSFLQDQLDNDLYAARDRFVSSATDRPGTGRPPRDSHDVGFLGPAQSVDTLAALVVNGKVTDALVIDRTGAVKAVPADGLPVIQSLPVDGRPHSAELGGLGGYRLLAVTDRNGDVLITGLPLAGVNEVMARLVTAEVSVLAVAVIVAGIAGATLVRRELRPLRRVAATATAVTELPLDRGDVALPERVPAADTDPRTEVGQVGAAVNRMLDHVGAALTFRQESETRLRRFIADASHELRTPLSAIRGYAELTRRDRDAVPPDVSHALSRMESQAERMSMLVEDLLLLARLDAGRPLERANVDLSRVVVDSVSDAHAVAPDHIWRLELPDEPVTMIGDSARLQQVVANLLANARTHTPPGTKVTVGLVSYPGGGVTLRVTDDGPGIPPELLPVVFHRFARGERSRSRAADGTSSTGLGLAIVSAVVGAHGGGVTVDSRPGHTTFSVWLPGGNGLRPYPAGPALGPAAN